MLKFILRRCLEAIPTLFILITISFFMMRLAPGSPFTGERTLPPEVMANIEAKYHLNDPIMTQYFNYLKQLAHGDFGPSFKYKDYSVNDLVAASFPVSAKLGFAAFLLAVVIGVAAGVIAALKQNTRWDYAVMGVAMTGVVIPSFVVAPLLVMIFAITLHWLPGGAGTLEEIFEQWTWAQLGIHEKPCAFLNIKGYYDPLQAMVDNMVQEGFMHPRYAEMLPFATSADEIIAGFRDYTPPARKWVQQPAI